MKKKYQKGFGLTMAVMLTIGTMTQGGFGAVQVVKGQETTAVQPTENEETTVSSGAVTVTGGAVNTQTPVPTITGGAVDGTTEPLPTATSQSAETVKPTATPVVTATPDPISISATKKTVLTGLTCTLKVKNATEKVVWSSSKKTVAKVSSKGVVTGLKAGTTVITAKANGQKVTCKVTVKENVYKGTVSKKITFGGDITRVTYKNGKLVCKFKVVNKTGVTITGFKDFYIKGTTKGKKSITNWTSKKLRVRVEKNQSKTVTITIPASKVKIKDADLRKASFKVGGVIRYKL